MAQFVVSLVVDKIDDLSSREAASLDGVEEEVQRLQAALKQVQRFLNDAEPKQENESVRNWLAEIRELAYDAEDVIDTFIQKVSRRERRSGTLKKFTSICTKGYLHKINTHIISIRDRIVGISNSLQTNGINEGEESSSRSEMPRGLRISYPYSSDVISLDDSKRNLMFQLMKEDERLRVVSVVGMGGLGKTFLAKEVYNLINVNQHFDCVAWVSVSQRSTKDVLSEILTKEFLIQVDTEGMGEQDLVNRLEDVLREKRYLVVLDNIWRTEAWDALKPAFPNERKGSKVLLTTRIEHVALYADPDSSPIQLPFLKTKEGWELLCRKAFPRDTSREDGFLKEYEKVGNEMVKKCGGLPQAIEALGEELATKSLDGWKEEQRSFNSPLQRFQGLKSKLKLSYHDLPYHLKPCFLSFASFPNDWEIGKKRLILLWIAEGFISPQREGEGEETMEDVAEQYLKELISRCMVQMRKRDHKGKGEKTCRIHCLMRDLCLSIAREEGFLSIIDTSSNMHATTGKSCRIAVHGPPFKLSMPGHQCSRSLFLFSKGSDTNLTKQEEHLIYKNFKLRVLHLEIKAFRSREIGNLIHLRHLTLSGISDETLLEDIGNLRNLFTLDLRGLRSVRLPNALAKLECLRHLLINKNVRGSFQIHSLRKLETLKRINAKHLISALPNLTNLRNLKIDIPQSSDVMVVLESDIFRSGSLRSLHMCMSLNYSYPYMEPLSQCYNLSKLEVFGMIRENLRSSCHNLGFLPANLAKLTLRFSYLKQDPMAMLETLPNLKFLFLGFCSYDGSKMVCSARRFLKLEILKFVHLEKLEEWQIEKSAMPCLKSLSIDELPECKIPEGLKFVTTIREFTIHRMPPEFVTWCATYFPFVSEEGFEQQPANNWRGVFNISPYTQHFNVDTDIVLNRLLSSLYPMNGDFFNKIDANPDLYGLIWISTTLVFVLAALGNCATYLIQKRSDSTTSWSFDVSYVNVAAISIYGYAIVVPLAFYFLIQYLGSNASLVRFWCMWGYSLFVFVPSSFLLVIPVEILRWIIILVTGIASSSLVALNIRSYVVGNDLTMAVIASLFLQLALAIFTKFLLLIPVEILWWIITLVTSIASYSFVALNLRGNDLTVALNASFFLQLALTIFIKFLLLILWWIIILVTGTASSSFVALNLRGNDLTVAVNASFFLHLALAIFIKFPLLFPVEILRWIIILVTGTASSSFVALNLRSYIVGNDLTVAVIGSFFLQLALAIFIKVWFFL